MSEAGLDRDAVRRALVAQDEAALAIAGVSRSAFGLSETRPLFRTPGWGTSSKQAIMRAHDVAKHCGDSRMRAGHLLLGVLAAEHGTVPRLLSFAGVDRAQLAESTRAAVDAARRP